MVFLMTTAINSLINLLKAQQLMAGCAESCTGGLLASLLTHNSGSSTWFEAGFVTYSNDAKTKMLGVPADLINHYGAVSIEVAHAMVQGVLTHCKADTAVSITGIAGPTGGSIEKPVGTVCFGFAYHDKPIMTLKHQFHETSREAIREAACEFVCLQWLAYLKN